MKKTAAPSPEDGDIGAKLDRIIELLEQRAPYVYPYTPVYPRPYYPGYYGPYWWGSGTVGGIQGVTTINYATTNGTAK